LHCLVTGATGFVGRALVPHLRAIGHEVTAWPRSGIFDLAGTPTDTTSTKWIAQLRGVDTVVHLAGLAHQQRGTQARENYFRLNRDGTLRLAAAARAAGVKRFIFLSSVKVFGEGGAAIYNELSQPTPRDAYAESKWQAEQLLTERFAQTMELVILRPPMVYGRAAKANFANLMRLAQLPIPLPFAGIDNRRALIGLDNLIDLIALCLTSPDAAGKTLLCADAKLYSLPDIITAIRHALNRDSHLFRLPKPVLRVFEALLGSSASTRLFGDFQVDCSNTCAALGWTPPFSMEQILRCDARDSRA